MTYSSKLRIQVIYSVLLFLSITCQQSTHRTAQAVPVVGPGHACLYMNQSRQFQIDNTLRCAIACAKKSDMLDY